jgi:hypothetical protein
LKAIPSRPLVCRLCLSTLLSLSLLVGLSRTARAEKIIMKGDDWEVFTDGRMAGFVSQVNGDGPPIPSIARNPDGTPILDPYGNVMQTDQLDGGGWTSETSNATPAYQGTVNMMRIRSGFLGNQFNFGVRGKVTPWTTVTGYVSIWAYIESDGRIKSLPNPADVRQGYAKIEGPWGSFLAGRTRTLFSRGATDINVLYAHRWGVGFPNSIDGKGPTSGMVGFGVLGAGFGAGLIYGTPVLGGLQLNIGAFDPVALSGAGSWTRTSYARPEAELTFQRTFGSTGKIVLFANGAYQPVYKNGLCVVSATTPSCSQVAEGVGYGGRFELGIFHLGLAGHYGKGLGLSYALENSYAALDPQGTMRTFDGYYGQTQFVLGRFDLFAGSGITRVFLTDYDKNNPTTPFPTSYIKYQWGTNAGVVFNETANVHFDLEYFRAQAAWWLGEKQVLNCFAFGMTFNW